MYQLQVGATDQRRRIIAAYADVGLEQDFDAIHPDLMQAIAQTYGSARRSRSLTGQTVFYE
jgi:hypothetical protein